MANDNNKVLFGFSKLYIGTYSVSSDGTVTIGAPYKQDGAVGLVAEPQDENNTFYADNVPYYTSYSGGTREGDLTVARFDDTFKEQFMGYRRTADGGLAEIKGAVKPNVYIMFALDGDAEELRYIMYNGAMGSINREFSTKEETAEPVTESIPITFNGDNATGMTTVTYKPGDDGYATLFTDPPAPALAP